MANTLGNLSLSDMKWLGTPADPIGSYQKGVNIAEQRQRMGQSADMHPLKMEALSQQTSLAAQRERHATKMNPLLQARQGIDNQNAITQGKLMSDQHALNEGTLDSRKSLMDSLAKTKKLAHDTAQRTQGDDILIKKAQRELMEINAELARATKGQATEARIAQLNAQKSVAENIIETGDADVLKTYAQADHALSQARLARGMESHLINRAKGQAGLANRSLMQMAYDHNRQVQADGREDRSRTAHEFDLDMVSAAYSVGNFAALERLTPDPTSTPGQKLDFEAYKTNIMAQHEVKKWNANDKRVDSNRIVRDAKQRDSFSKIPDDAVHALFTEPPQPGATTPAFTDSSGKPTAYGIKQYNNYDAVEKLKAGGGITQADVDALQSVPYTIAGSPYAAASVGTKAGGDFHLGGNLFIPNDDSVRKLQELSAQRAAAKVAGTKTELTYRDKQTGAEIKVLPPSGKERADQLKFEETYATEVANFVKTLTEEEGPPTEEQLRSIYKGVSESIKMGGVFAGAPLVSTQPELDAVRQANPSSAHWVFDMTSGKFHHAKPLSGVSAPPTVAPGAAAPGAIDPYTGQPETAPYVAEDVFNARKEIHEQLTGAGIDPKLAQKIVWRGAKSDFGISTNDYDADEPISKLVRQVYEDAQDNTEDALDDLLKGIHAGKGSKRPWIKTKTSQTTLDRQIRLLGNNLDKPTSQWPKIGGRAWTPSEVTAARKYLPIYRAAARYQVELKEAMKKVPEK